MGWQLKEEDRRYLCTLFSSSLVSGLASKFLYTQSAWLAGDGRPSCNSRGKDMVVSRRESIA